MKICQSLFFPPFIIIALLFSLSLLVTQIRGHEENSSPSSPLRFAPCILSREGFSCFFPRRLASNCWTEMIIRTDTTATPATQPTNDCYCVRSNFLNLTSSFICCTRHAWCASTCGAAVPLLVAPVGGCPAVVCLCCTRTAVQQQDVAEPGFVSAQNGYGKSSC